MSEYIFLKKKIILGKNKNIYTKKNSLKEYVKYKKIMTNVVEYKKIKNAKNKKKIGGSPSRRKSRLSLPGNSPPGIEPFTKHKRQLTQSMRFQDMHSNATETNSRYNAIVRRPPIDLMSRNILKTPNSSASRRRQLSARERRINASKLGKNSAATMQDPNPDVDELSKTLSRLSVGKSRTLIIDESQNTKREYDRDN
tara:strand:+ start:2050 stop:2640 length:591 start_codon:yes stop_codon:yes gene_type:complete